MTARLSYDDGERGQWPGNSGIWQWSWKGRFNDGSGLLWCCIFAHHTKPDIVDGLRWLVVHSKGRPGASGAVQPRTASHRFSANSVALTVAGNQRVWAIR